MYDMETLWSEIILTTYECVLTNQISCFGANYAIFSACPFLSQTLYGNFVNKIFIYSALCIKRQLLAEPETGGGSKMRFGRMAYHPMDLVLWIKAC